MKTTHCFALLLSSVALAFAAPAKTDFHTHLGLQLYSLRATTLTKGLPASLDLVKSWGITEVEGGGAVGSVTAEQIRADLDARGLKQPSMHVGYDRLAKDIAGVIQDAKTLGSTYVVCPWIPHKESFDAATATKAIEDFNTWGAALRAAGLTFAYHIHGYEFAPGSKSGEQLFDEMVQGTDPRNVSFELDVFWAVHGGADPVKLMKKYPQRWVALHVKDIRKGAPTGFTTGHAPETDNVSVGDGQIDWKTVLTEAQSLGIPYYFIEDETAAPLENVPASMTYLRALKL